MGQVSFGAYRPLMKILIQRLCFAALLLLVSVPVLSGAEPSPVPKHFSASIGGFMGGTYRVEYRDGTLTYTTFDPGHRNPRPVAVHPGEAQWREFRQTLDALKVWQWRAQYQSEGVADGTQWSLDIAYTDRALKSEGSNNYPDAAGRPSGNPQPSDAFNRYLAAVGKLMGNKTFR
jgi:hypothetical protein